MITRPTRLRRGRSVVGRGLVGSDILLAELECDHKTCLGVNKLRRVSEIFYGPCVLYSWCSGMPPEVIILSRVLYPGNGISLASYYSSYIDGRGDRRCELRGLCSHYSESSMTSQLFLSKENALRPGLEGYTAMAVYLQGSPDMKIQRHGFLLYLSFLA